MTPASVLAALRARGVKVTVLDGDRLAVSPGSALDDRLRDAVRREKRALVALLRDEPLPSAPAHADYPGIYQTLTETCGTAEDLTAFEWYASLSGDGIIDEIAALERRCEDLARDGADEGVYRAAVTALVERIRQIRDWHREAQRTDEPVPAPHPAPPAWRIVVESCEPVAGPVSFNRAETVLDPARYIESTIAELELALEAKSAGRERSQFAGLIEERLARLAACGCIARVEVAQ